MPFEVLKAKEKVPPGTVHPFRIGMRQRGKAARMALTFHKPELVKVFGSADAGDRFKIELGTGTDHALLRITEDPEGPHQLSRAPGKGSPYLTLLLPVVDRFPNCKVNYVPASFKPHENGKGQPMSIIVTMPGWAWDEQAKKGREIAAERDGAG